MVGDKGASLDFVRTVKEHLPEKSENKEIKTKVILVADFDQATAIVVQDYGLIPADAFAENGKYQFNIHALGVVLSTSKEGLQEEMLQTKHHRILQQSLAGRVVEIDFLKRRGSTVNLDRYDEIITDQTYIRANPSVYRGAQELFAKPK